MQILICWNFQRNFGHDDIPFQNFSESRELLECRIYLNLNSRIKKRNRLKASVKPADQKWSEGGPSRCERHRSAPLSELVEL